ncbi:MAG TPA: DNA primase [Vicinamibacterales bacterium]|jgi:DNA primase|nr:DNA primase [Acidobacteriota bacterium]HQX82217.1 DNA primase [Vicinamibacterales bacterium]
MALFPQTFLDDLKAQTDIVAIIGDVTPLKKAGASWKGLCPFHTEKSPSFTVSQDKGFFKCFGCDAKGDVVKFVELHQKITFPEAIRYLAQRASMTIPEVVDGQEDRVASAEREALVKLHEDAQVFYLEQLAGPAGVRARRELETRGLTEATIGMFGYGYAPAAGRDTLHSLFAGRKVPLGLQIKTGLVMERDDGRVADRFRHRLMIPIRRDTGALIGFGGRALDDGQVPKYLNSPETPIYTKGRTLYGLDVTKGAIRKHNYCVLVEGYFDLAQVWQAGMTPVVASSGTALTVSQAKLLKRFAGKIVLSFDPDAAGQGAAVRSSELLVAEGFQVNVALLPEGSDPDTYIRKAGGRAYTERLKASRPYLEFLLDRAAERLDLNRPEGRRMFIGQMLSVAATIPDAAARDQFADRLAHKARITEAVVRDEIRKAAAQRKTEAPAIAVPVTVRLLAAEQGLLWTLVHQPVEGLAALAHLEPGDLDGLMSAPVFLMAQSLAEMPADVLPDLLQERLNEGERALLARAASTEAAAPPTECVNALKRRRLERERSEVQEQIDRLQASSGTGNNPQFAELWARKLELLQRLESLNG